jgi:hypothetical protein
MTESNPVRTPNTAEEFVFYLCKQTFLSLWSYQNPKQQARGKELCDVLVVFDPHIFIFSVKDVGLRTSPERLVGQKRWLRKAVEESCKQIYGAEAVIRASTGVVRRDDSPGVRFPSPAIIHRVAIAFGSQGRVPLPFGNFGKGFVHVFDERSTPILLTELDTIADFAQYLEEKERFFLSVNGVLFSAEEDLLALYLHQGRKFPAGYDVVLIDNNLWEKIKASPEYQRKRAADTQSFAWDGLIEVYCKHTLSNNLEFGPGLSETERAVRIMARESRFARRILGKSFREFLDSSHQIAARMTRSPSGIVYVFVAKPHGTPRRYRLAELGNRCFVARGLNPGAETVIGIATEQYEKGKGFSLDLHHLYKPTWTAADQAHMEGMQQALGYFVSPRVSVEGEDEYPAG